MNTIYEYSAVLNNGQEVSLEQYKGKVLLIVNTASACGFTPQYEGLQKLYDEYKEQGFEILAFPCNQFNNQEKGSDEEIKQFCDLNFNINFPLFKKVDVNGDNAHPLFTFLKMRPLACLAVRGSNGISPNSWLARTAMLSHDLLRQPNQKH